MENKCNILRFKFSILVNMQDFFFIDSLILPC